MELLDKIKGYIKTEHPEIYIMESNMSEGNKSVELYIDTDLGITINECVELSKEILETYPEVGEYQLIVSSPGLTRPLTHEFQFKRSIGRRLEIYDKNSGKKIIGELKEVNYPTIKIETLKLRGKAYVKDKELELKINSDLIVKIKI